MPTNSSVAKKNAELYHHQFCLMASSLTVISFSFDSFCIYSL